MIMGLLLTIISIPMYLYSPHFLSQVAHSFISSMSGGSTNTSGMLREMGYPSMSTVISMVQYTAIGLTFAGSGLIMFGTVAKPVPKKVKVKPVIEKEEKIEEIPVESHPMDKKLETNLRSLRILQERLAKGEITSNEFQNLKRFLE